MTWTPKTKTDFITLVGVVDASLNNQETADCIDDSFERKEAEAFHYEDAAFDVCLFAYRNFTLDYWVFNYAVSGTFTIATVGSLITDKMESFIDGKSTDDYRIRITTNADTQIIDWIKANSTDYLSDNELEQLFTRGGE